MEHITGLIIAVIGLVTGGGLMKLLNYQAEKRKATNAVVFEEYKSLDKIIEDFNSTNAKLVQEMSQIRMGALATDQLLQMVKNAIQNEDFQEAKRLLESEAQN